MQPLIRGLKADQFVVALGESIRLRLPAEGHDHRLAGWGEITKRTDGKLGFRVHASNGQVVATDGGQRYDRIGHARETLEKLLRGEYQGEIREPRQD